MQRDKIGNRYGDGLWDALITVVGGIALGFFLLGVLAGWGLPKLLAWFNGTLY